MIFLRRGITDELLDAVWLGLCDVGTDNMVWASPGTLATYLFPFNVIGGYDEDGECIGAVWFHGKDIHIALSPECRKTWASRHLLKQFFTAFFAQSDEAEVFVNTEGGHKFVKALGFRRHETEDGNTRYTLRRDHARFYD